MLTATQILGASKRLLKPSDVLCPVDLDSLAERIAALSVRASHDVTSEKRDALGKWAKYSEIAGEESADADKASREAFESGDADDHQRASRRHRAAAHAHEYAAKKEGGNAIGHNQAAEFHKRKEAEHARLSGREVKASGTSAGATLGWDTRHQWQPAHPEGDPAGLPSGKIKHAVLVIGGKRYKGPSHFQAWAQYADGRPNDNLKWGDVQHEGFETESGHFLHRQQAADYAIAISQLHPNARAPMGLVSEGLRLAANDGQLYTQDAVQGTHVAEYQRHTPSGGVATVREHDRLPTDFPGEFKKEISTWKHVSKSPYSSSFYDVPDKGWHHTPEGSLRIADHWNFKTDGDDLHATTDKPVPHGHWALGKYEGGTDAIQQSHTTKEEAEITAERLSKFQGRERSEFSITHKNSRSEKESRMHDDGWFGEGDWDLRDTKMHGGGHYKIIKTLPRNTTLPDAHGSPKASQGQGHPGSSATVHGAEQVTQKLLSRDFNCGENEIQASLINFASAGATPAPATILAREPVSTYYDPRNEAESKHQEAVKKALAVAEASALANAKEKDEAKAKRRREEAAALALLLLGAAGAASYALLAPHLLRVAVAGAPSQGPFPTPSAPATLPEAPTPAVTPFGIVEAPTPTLPAAPEAPTPAQPLGIAVSPPQPEPAPVAEPTPEQVADMLDGRTLEKAAEDFADERAEFLKPFCADIQEAMRLEVEVGKANGESIHQIGRRLFDLAQGVYGSRGAVLAATEAQSAYGHAQLRALAAAGYRTANWIQVDRETKRESHAENVLAGPLPIGDTWPNGQKFPGDPIGGPGECINCLCELAGADWHKPKPERVLTRRQQLRKERLAKRNTSKSSDPSAPETIQAVHIKEYERKAGEAALPDLSSLTCRARRKALRAAKFESSKVKARDGWVTIDHHPVYLGDKEEYRDPRQMELKPSGKKPSQTKGRRGLWIRPRSDNTPDILDAIQDLGGIKPPQKEAGAEYDSWKENMRGTARLLISKKAAHTPDTIIEELKAVHGFNRINSPDELLEAIGDASKQREGLKQSGGGSEAQSDRFWTAIEAHSDKSGLRKINVDELGLGDSFHLKGPGISHEVLKVTHIDQDGDVTVKDGRMLGTQNLPEGTEIWVRERGLKLHSEVAKHLEESEPF